MAGIHALDRFIGSDYPELLTDAEVQRPFGLSSIVAAVREWTNAKSSIILSALDPVA